MPFTSGDIYLRDLTTNSLVFQTAYSPVPSNGNPALSVLQLTGLNIHLNAGDHYELYATSITLSNTNDEIYKALIHVPTDGVAF